jgi:hypothetical protein
MALRRDRSATKWEPMFRRFIANMRIDSKEVPAIDDKGSPFKLWRSQEIALKTLCDGLEEGIREFYFLKARQQGITTIDLGLVLFWLAVHSRTLGALVVDTETNRDAFRNTLERMCASLPQEFTGRSFVMDRNNKGYMLWSNESRLDFLVAGTKSKTTWAESRGYTVAILTEVSKYGTRAGLDSFYETLPQNNPNRLVIYESTANGWANHWRDMWEEAGRDQFTKRRRFLGWWANDLNRLSLKDARYAVYGRLPPSAAERELIADVWNLYQFKVTQDQLAWYRWRDASKSRDEGSLAQNQPWTESEAFIRSGASFFHLKVIQQKMQELSDQGVEMQGYRFYLGETMESGTIERITEQERLAEVEFKVYEPPVAGATYSVALDPAYGRDGTGDNHAICVCRCYADRLVQVAEYASNTVETHVAAWVLAYIASWYRNVWVIIELGGPGRAVFHELNIQHQRLRSDLYRPRAQPGQDDPEAFLEHAQWYMYHRPDTMAGGFLWHFETTYRTKPVLMNMFRDSFSTKMFDPKSARLLEEMATMVQERSDIGPSAPGTDKDDRVIAAAMCNHNWLEWIRPTMIDEGQTYRVVQQRENQERPSVADVANLIVQGVLRNIEGGEGSILETEYDDLGLL